MGMNDALTTSNTVYLFDGPAKIGSTAPPVIHSDLSVQVMPPNNGQLALTTGTGHANHVAGILQAKSNNAMVRGANPNAPVLNVNIGASYPEAIVAMDWALQDAETRGIYAVGSASWVDSSGVFFGPSGTVTRAARRLSTRLAFVMAAGNFAVGACPMVYQPTNTNDGILVVGGVAENGTQAGMFFNMPYAPDQPGTNFGPCVEVWGPAQKIWSTWNTSTTATVRLSGTSMAAPYVAAMIARYGNNNTTPVERENYARAKLVSTGSFATDGATIALPTYTQPPSFTIPARLSISAITADATLAGSSAANVNDKLYLTGVWNNGHAPPGWIQLDLGATKNLRVIRLVPELSPTPTTMTYQIYAGNTNPPTTLVATMSGSVATLEPTTQALSVSGRYVRVNIQSGGSWGAFREIEVYGY